MSIIKQTSSRLVAIISCGIMLCSASANASTIVAYTGNPFTTGFGTPVLSGPITGFVHFSTPLTNGAVLSSADVMDFQFTSDGLTWTSAATINLMDFVIGPSLLPTSWDISIEQETLGGNTGPEQLITSSSNFGFFAIAFDEVVVGDDRTNDPFSDPENQYQNISSQGEWPLVPEPGTLTILGLGLAGLFYTRRRKTA